MIRNKNLQEDMGRLNQDYEGLCSNKDSFSNVAKDLKAQMEKLLVQFQDSQID